MVTSSKSEMLIWTLEIEENEAFGEDKENKSPRNEEKRDKDSTESRYIVQVK